jgi:hypothetical protein
MCYSNLQQVHYKSYKVFSLALSLLIAIALYLIQLKSQLISICIMPL